MPVASASQRLHEFAIAEHDGDRANQVVWADAAAGRTADGFVPQSGGDQIEPEARLILLALAVLIAKGDAPAPLALVLNRHEVGHRLDVAAADRVLERLQREGAVDRLDGGLLARGVNQKG